MKRKKEKMSKKQFAETMAQELNRYFEENLTMEVHAAIREFVKTNDYTHYAIVLERPGVYALPALNVDIFYEEYKHGESIESISRSLAWNAMGAIMMPPPVNGMDGIPKKDFGVKLSARVVSKRRNEKYLEDVPCRDVVPGITMFASVEVIVEDMDSWQCRITNPMMKEMEYQPDELIDEALMLSEEYYPPMLMTFSDGNAEGENLLEKEGYAMNDDSMYILTTNRFQLGAVALFYPGVAEKIAEMAGGNFYAIPSSVHEFIILPESDKYAEEELQAMLESGNREVVSEDDILSDTIYVYDRHLGLLLSCSEYSGMCGTEFCETMWC